MITTFFQIALNPVKTKKYAKNTPEMRKRGKVNLNIYDCFLQNKLPTYFTKPRRRLRNLGELWPDNVRTEKNSHDIFQDKFDTHQEIAAILSE